MGFPSIMKMSFQTLTVYPTDKDGSVSFNTEYENANRCVQIFRFYIALNFSPPEQKKEEFKKKENFRRSYNPNALNEVSPSSKLEQYSPNGKESSQHHRHHDLNIDQQYDKIKDCDSYFLFPMDVILKISTVQDTGPDFLKKPQNFINLQVLDPIILLINSQTTKYLTSLNNHLSIMQIVQKNLHLRPLETPSENYRAWWRYAIKAVREERKRSESLSQVSAQKLIKMRTYINLYKRKQTIVLSKNITVHI